MAWPCRKPTASQADPAARLPSAEVLSVFYHIGFHMVLELVLGSSLLPQLETAHIDAGSPRQLLCLGSGCNKLFPHLGHGRGKRHLL